MTKLQFLIFSLLLSFCAGCTTSQPASSPPRHFDFSKDTFAYANGLVWEYRYDQNGKWTTRRREPPPSYSQHCFVVSRTACQFFENARFDPSRPKTDEATYRRLIQQLVSTSLRTPLPENEKIVFPGYADLRSFSQDQETLLKAECGGAWRCYFQRGNWRMIFPFTRHQQQVVAKELEEEVQQRGAVVVHLVRFPQLSINHAVLMFEATANPKEVQFLTYDPNEPAQPVIIRFDRATRTFNLPTNAYFQGGRVDVYPIYDRWLY
jgi:hypothetical protein